MKTRYFTNLFAILMVFNGVSVAQIQTPQASPPSKISQLVGLTQVSLEYSRPSMRDRKVFGELVPYGEVWRTGANSATAIEFSSEVTIEGKKLDAGKYAIYTIPERKNWTIVFSKNTSLWGAVGYDEKDDVLRVSVPSGKLKNTLETLQIDFSDITDTGASVNIKWEKSVASFRIETEVDPIVMKQIREQVIEKEPASSGTYFQAANYYFSTGKDLSQALEWIGKSVEADPRYWSIHLKAKIEQRLGLKEEAKVSAEKSMELAKVEKNMDYVRLNETLIKSIK